MDDKFKYEKVSGFLNPNLLNYSMMRLLGVIYLLHWPYGINFSMIHQQYNYIDWQCGLDSNGHILCLTQTNRFFQTERIYTYRQK